jgi:hypothetical protein
MLSTFSDGNIQSFKNQEIKIIAIGWFVEPASFRIINYNQKIFFRVILIQLFFLNMYSQKINMLTPG